MLCFNTQNADRNRHGVRSAYPAAKKLILPLVPRLALRREFMEVFLEGGEFFEDFPQRRSVQRVEIDIIHCADAGVSGLIHEQSGFPEITSGRECGVDRFTVA